MKITLAWLTAIFLVIALFGIGGTWAYFQDDEISANNTFQAGTLDLKIRNDEPGPWQDGVSGNWTMPNMAPGDETEGEVKLHIDSASIPADHLEITGDYAVPGFLDLENAMAKAMLITEMEYSKGAWVIDLLVLVDDVDGDGKISLYDLKYSQGGNGIDNLPPPYGVWEFKMKIKFDENAGNQFQGKTLNLTMIFTLNQDASQ